MSQDFVLKLIQDIQASSHVLPRTPESTGEMAEENSVNDFNQAMRTNLTVNYAAALDYIHRVRPAPNGKNLSALDLCSGPGNFTQCLATYLGYRNLTGVDISRPMIAHAQNNARKSKSQSNFQFVQQDVLRLRTDRFEKFDLVTCANSAHHLNTIEDVRSLLTLADGACDPQGVVVVTDLCRLPNQDVTNRFVAMIGDDYVQNNLHALAEDFRASMHAAWSPEEMARAIPKATNRAWYQVVAGGLPFFQAMIGLPYGREELFIRESKDWANSGIHRTERASQDWQMTKDIYYAGMVRCLKPARKSEAA
jgi:2-polyprenyl-3-methyl-5-hydroxy-6-metoxy-1,4-benzoquinol methylase